MSAHVLTESLRLQTDPMAPFGIVTLADSGGEGAPANAMGTMHLAQTAGHGVLPGPDGSGMENTFLAQVCVYRSVSLNPRLALSLTPSAALSLCHSLVSPAYHTHTHTQTACDASGVRS